jgi:two-component system, chemotaxis family, response regulator Rcp1
MPIARPPIQILLVEDNPADVRLTVEAFREGSVPTEIHVARDGAEAVAWLKEPSRDTPRPDLILLDLNLPRKHGREVLTELKKDDALRHIPVVVLTTSQAEQDILDSYRQHASAVITKPLDVDQFFKVVRAIEQFWLDVANLSRL